MHQSNIKNNSFADKLILLFVSGTLLFSSKNLFDFTSPLRFLAFLILLLLLWWKYIYSAKNKLSVPRILLLLLIFIIWQFLSVLYADNLSLVYGELFKNIVFLLGIIFLTQAFDIDAAFKLKLFQVLAIISLIWNFFGLIDFFENSHYLQLTDRENYFIASTFSNKNLYSSALLLTLPINFFVFFSSFNWFKNIVGFNIFVSLFLIISLNTKSVWLSASMLLLVIFFYFVFLHYKQIFEVKQFLKVNRIFIIALLLFLLTVVAIKITMISDKPVDRITRLVTKSDEASTMVNSTAERLFLWKNSFAIFKQNSLLGVGTGNWKREINNLGVSGTSAEKGNVYYVHPHNELVNVFTENGVIGGILYLSFFLMCLMVGIKNIMRRENVHEAFFALSGIIIFFIYSQFEYPFSRPEHLFLLAIYCSVLFTTSKRVFELSQLKIVSGFVLIPLFFYSVYLVKFNYHLQKINSYRLSERWADLLKEKRKINGSLISSDMNSIPIEWQTGTAYFRLGNINEAKISFAKAYEQFPYNLHVVNNLATCYQLSGDTKKAIELYNEALRISNHFDEARLNLGIVLYNGGEMEKCKFAISKISDVKLITANMNFFIDVIDPTREKNFKDADEIVNYLTNINKK